MIELCLVDSTVDIWQKNCFFLKLGQLLGIEVYMAKPNIFGRRRMGQFCQVKSILSLWVVHRGLSKMTIQNDIPNSIKIKTWV